MAPKKGKKITLNEFLGDNTFGSWADEMDALPSAPATKSDDYQPRRLDRFTKGEDVIRVDRPGPPREDLPLPTQPPYTAFIGNLAFDLTEVDLETFFAAFNPKSVKVIRDKEEKPKGFGYVEFEYIDGLKDALAKSGSTLSGRTIRVSVAEPPKERTHLPGIEDSSKFEGPWRREGPLPDLPEREHSRRRFDGLSAQDRSAASDASTDWRSNRPRIPEVEVMPHKRKGSGFSTPPNFTSSADKEEVWSIGSKFKSSDDTLGTRPPIARMRLDAKDGPSDDTDWRNPARPRTLRNDGSPAASNPPTPQLGRRKLELLPRSGNASSSPSPMSSPKMSPASSSRPNPFGAAKPVDISHRDKEVGERLERERDVAKERLSMSRTSSRGATERTIQSVTKVQTTLPTNHVSSAALSTAPTVRPTLSFANVAANKESTKKQSETPTETN